MTERSIPVGYVRRAHGIGGDVVVRGLTSDAHDRIVEGGELTTGGDPAATYRVESVRSHKGDLVVHLADVDTRNDAEALVATQFVIDASERRTLADDEWWADDLVGCVVVDVERGEVGSVVDTVDGAAQDRLVVERFDGVRFEIPLVDALVPTVDVAARRIEVDLPAGLMDEDESPGSAVT